MKVVLRWTAALAALSCFAVAGCGKSVGTSKSPSAGGAGSPGEVEVASFQGGYGIDFFERAAREYEAKHPGVKIRVWGNPRVWEQLRPRFVALFGLR